MRHISDIIVITSPKKNVTKLTSQDFSILGPIQSKFLGRSVLKNFLFFLFLKDEKILQIFFTGLCD